MIIVVGAGLAGLTCAKILHQQGRQVLVVDAGDGPGGRVRTRVHPEGFLLDQGFQVLFTAYPAARRHLSFTRLDLREFDPGAIIATDKGMRTLSDPFQRPSQALPTLFSGAMGLGDKWRVALLRSRVMRRKIEEIFKGEDTSTHDFLQGRGFSDRALATFFEPFFGGVFYDSTLSTSAQMFQFTFKMLSEGRTVVPAGGMEAIAQQLARAIPYDNIRYRLSAQAIVSEDGEARGVRLASGETLAATQVVVATDAREAQRLTSVSLPTEGVSGATIYFSSPVSLYSGKQLVLNARAGRFINNLVQITNIAPEYAPQGQHLLSCTVLGLPDGDDRSIVERCRQDLTAIFPKHDLRRLRGLDVVRIPFAQFAQPPGIYGTLPGHGTPIRGLYLAGEYTNSSSIHGALESGENAANYLLTDGTL